MVLVGRKRALPWIFLVVALSDSVVPGFLIADDEGKGNPPSKAAPSKPDAPTPGLTERERWLLDRVEQLEKRVSDLETKTSSAAAPAAATASSQPGSLNPVTSALAPSASPAPTAAETNVNVISVEKALASANPQATEQGN